MTLKEFGERWEAKETKVGKFFKYILGYTGMFAGIVTETVVNYLPAVSQYVPDKLSHALVSIGVICYVIGKLTKTDVQK